MNKTEQEIINAIIGNQNKYISNTGIKHTETTCIVSLHCSPIAVFDKTKETLELSDCNWCTKTTASRLNAILEWFYPSITVKRKKGSTIFIKGREVVSRDSLKLSLKTH